MHCKQPVLHHMITMPVTVLLPAFRASLEHAKANLFRQIADHDQLLIMIMIRAQPHAE